MTDDEPLAMIEFLTVFRMYTGARLERAVNQKRNLPGQTMQVFQHFRKWLGLLLGEVL